MLRHLPCLLLLVACGPRAMSSDEGGGRQSGLDTSQAGITAFVKEGQYKSWAAEPAIHETSAPHKSRVRVFFNDVVVQSLKAGQNPVARGSILVKELYGSDGQPAGHALNVKVADGAGKDTWIFYEGFTSDGYQDPYYGKGHPTCHGCHSAGVDYITSKLP